MSILRLAQLHYCTSRLCARVGRTWWYSSVMKTCSHYCCESNRSFSRGLAPSKPMLGLSWQMQSESCDFLCILRETWLQEGALTGWEFFPESALSWFLREKSKKSKCISLSGARKSKSFFFFFQRSVLTSQILMLSCPKVWQQVCAGA